MLKIRQSHEEVGYHPRVHNTADILTWKYAERDNYIIGLSFMHKYSPVSDSAWVVPISLQQMHSSTLDMQLHIHTFVTHKIPLY